ncbi:norsolorinic acid reductase [Diaporthe helianthi]|uniref:Norsolorinic acid reductase n=1 Tax=Diaporthe helianthi TaxID=158607 RepID=A0A2P5HM28_DIAHE|nr:norsolorinic acid reductase [Diaporthe helianthi]
MQAPPPQGPLERYRLLAPSASLRVSPLCLGSMNFGDSWKGFMGSCDQKTTESILDYFYEQGGNFIDTANIYQSEESESWIGEWMKKRENRQEMGEVISISDLLDPTQSSNMRHLVIATKYTMHFKTGPGKCKIAANFTGNGTKSMHVSLHASLKKLQTDYVDIFYVHWWDHSASIPEVMQSLNNAVLQGKVLYLGISDTPAWIVAKANQYARDHGLRQFTVYQGQWSAALRDFEREIIPMCRDEGMGLCPWGALGGGTFKTEEQRKAKDGRQGQVTEAQIKVSKVLQTMAEQKNTALTSIALAYVMHKTPYVFPIVGGRTLDQLKSNIQALKVRLSPAEIGEIEGAIPFDLGFPASFLYNGKQPDHPGHISMLDMAGTFDLVELPRPILPSDS